ncbi:T9SS sorting signal type C domain-containing protein [Flavobacterium restrictum]|uniref:T9SS sorting signal type C domain-containing protein n=1 Tax=Flavobacterium restrictum TaxID=2594428 RepID=A0A553DWN3_9FLAO|nr:T9SS sorting signal type C domain-containing protein [Flavobacterium restrictum]TRX37102.1 T9SS sorting signal type C domain-containing protein [Flavobacterium restrictum]
MKKITIALLLFCIQNTIAQFQNNAILSIGDTDYVYISSFNYSFGASGQTKTTRTASTYGKLVFGAAATWSGASNSHFVDGYVTTKGTAVFVLPIGQSSVYAPVQVIPTTTDGVDGAYFRTNPTTIGATLDATLGGISTVEYWDIKGAVADAKISLSWRNSSDVTNLTQYKGTSISSLSNLSIVGYDGAKWVLIPSTIDATSFLGTTSSLTEGSITTDGVVDLSLYTSFSLGAKESSCNLTTTWNGTSWSPFLPTASQKAIIAGNYSEAININACSLEVLGTAVVTVPTGFNFTISGKVAVARTASLTFENNANLVQVDDVPNQGKITSKRNSTTLMLLDYTLWSSPVAGQQLLSFSPATLSNRFYIYNPATNLYNVTTPTANFTTGTGYLIRMPNNHPTTPTVWNGSFTGIPNNGTVSLTVANNTYNGIGNPYPSTISADAFIDANNLTDALYFWRKTNGTTASYATYTKAGGTANAGGLSSIVPNGTIQVGQGFIAKSTSTTLIFTNAMRTANNTAPFLKTKAIEKSRIWLNLAKDTAPANQMMVAYMTGATAGIDAGIEGKYFNDSPIALNSIINNEEFVIQGKGLPFADSDVVPLTFKTNAAGNFTISIDHVEGLFSGNQAVFLNDKELGTSQDLKKGAYTFASAIGTFNNRFELVYKSSTALGLEEQEFSNSVLVYKQNRLIHINAGKTIMKTVRVFDMQGRLIFKQEKVNQNTTILKGFTAAEQTILVQITSDEDKIVTKKVMY